MAATFGSYDAHPRASGFVSQYRNLLHHFVHQTGRSEASTFWAGCGAVRRAAFAEVGGFDAARYGNASIEDIELGYRLRRAGHRIVLDKQLLGTHLKRWTLRSMVSTDLWRRAIPWSRLIFERSEFPADLNLKGAQRLSVALTGVATAFLALGVWRPGFLLAAIVAVAAVIVLNRNLSSSWHASEVSASRPPACPFISCTTSVAGSASSWPAWSAFRRAPDRGASLPAGRSTPMGAEAAKVEPGVDPAARNDDARADFVVIGGGPAGLTAAYELAKASRRPIVLEKQHLVGGLARTEIYKGFHFDMGGHRFFTKVRGGGGDLARGARRRVPPAPAPVAHLLRRQVLPLPAEAAATRSPGSVRCEARARSRSATSAGSSFPTARRTPSSSG